MQIQYQSQYVCCRCIFVWAYAPVHKGVCSCAHVCMYRQRSTFGMFFNGWLTHFGGQVSYKPGAQGDLPVSGSPSLGLPCSAFYVAAGGRGESKVRSPCFYIRPSPIGPSPQPPAPIIFIRAKMCTVRLLNNDYGGLDRQEANSCRSVVELRELHPLLRAPG